MVDSGAGPRQSEAYARPVLEMYMTPIVPIAGAVFKDTALRERARFVETNWIEYMIEASLKTFVYTFKILAGESRNVLVFL